MNQYSQHVLKNYFQDFYDGRIEKCHIISSEDLYNYVDIALVNFWFSVIDFYGGIYAVGVNNVVKENKYGIILANKKSFTAFIKEFFPHNNKENELGDILYNIFRSGMVHQLSPKMGTLIYDSNLSNLIWIKINSEDANERTNKTVTLNMHRLEKLAYDAYKEFKNRVSDDKMIGYCENIYNKLIKPVDRFEDGKSVDKEYQNLSSATRTLLTKNVVD